MNVHRSVATAARRQRGASAVEFAFVFPVLFMLMYATAVYAYVYVLQQAITYTAQYLAESAVAVKPTAQGTYHAQIQSRIQSLATNQLLWLPDSQRSRVIGNNGELVGLSFQTVDGNDVVVVTLNFDLTRSADFFPAITLPGVGAIPPLPAQLQAKATARLS